MADLRSTGWDTSTRRASTSGGLQNEIRLMRSRLFVFEGVGHESSRNFNRCSNHHTVALLLTFGFAGPKPVSLATLHSTTEFVA
jgi:hypothetical protein